MSFAAKRIEAILRQDPRARNSDTVLMIHMLQLAGMHLTPEQIDILKDFNFETIRRTRQKIQEEGKYPPTQEVAQGRKAKATKMQSAVFGTPDNIVDTMDNNDSKPKRLVNNGVYVPGSSPNIKTDVPIEQQTKLAELLDWNNGFK